MQRATMRGRNATGHHYNSSVHHVKPEVIISQFRLHDFLGSVEGSIWRAVRATTPPLVSLCPAASNAFNYHAPYCSSASPLVLSQARGTSIGPSHRLRASAQKRGPWLR